MFSDPGEKNTQIQGNNPHHFLLNYSHEIQKAIETVNKLELEKAVTLIENTRQNKRTIWVGGNGGSAAIADHLCCDFTKGTRIKHKHAIKTQSLMSNTAVLTALANDFGYEHSISFSLEMNGEEGDLMILISSSGNSANIINAAKKAKELNIKVIGMSGFQGGKLAEMSDVNLYVNSQNYGVVEDCHQMIMHSIAQFILKKSKEL